MDLSGKVHYEKRVRTDTYWPLCPFPLQPVHVGMFPVWSALKACRPECIFGGLTLPLWPFYFQSVSELISGNVIPESRREVNLSIILSHILQSRYQPRLEVPLCERHERITCSCNVQRRQTALCSTALDLKWNRDCEIWVLTLSFHFVTSNLILWPFGPVWNISTSMRWIAITILNSHSWFSDYVSWWL